MTSNVALSITYKYHPMPPLLKTDTHHIMQPSVEEFEGLPESPAMEEFIPLSYMRPESVKVPENFDAGTLDSDLISAELEVAPSVLCAYGSLLRNFLHVKVTCFIELNL